MLSLIFIIISL